ncbi:MAG: AAA family ATPase [Eubacteriales bacterium]|nr:AAA family ATPase [Eubacteriales bacterium]HBR31020.1 nucleoside kinase [Clostridiales bacterium]
MTPTNKQPLFIITGASCAGKSTICNELFNNEKDYIVMESDLLWNNAYNTPDDDYCEYRCLWMRLCANISQIEMPVVLCGCAVPEQYENQPERVFFTDIHYLAVVCEDDILEKRMREGRNVQDENWIKSSLNFNTWLKENADKTKPEITLLDNSYLNPVQSAGIVDDWIRKKVKL